MSPRSKPTPTWVTTATEIDPNGPAKVLRFTGVPLGKETVTIDITTEVDRHGHALITGLLMSKPISRRRLDLLPLAALLNACQKHHESHVTAMTPKVRKAYEAYLRAGVDDSRTAAALREIAAVDRKSDDFLAAVAAVCREARSQGEAAWRAVRNATTGTRDESDGSRAGMAQAQRYIAAADARAALAKTRVERERFDTGTVDRTTRVVSDTPIPLDVIHAKKGKK